MLGGYNLPATKLRKLGTQRTNNNVTRSQTVGQLR